MIQKYLILNQHNIADKYSMQTKLINTPVNYIEVEDESILWHKYENGEWSTEKYEPESTAPLTEFEQLKQDNTTFKQDLEKEKSSRQKFEGAVMELTTILAMQGGTI